MTPILRGIAIAGVFGMLTAAVMPAAAADYRGLYWYDKYFGAADPHAYRGIEARNAIPREELVARAFDQGFYNAHHLHHAVDKPEIYALAREGEFDNEVVIAIDARTGEVIDAVLLPH